MPHKAVPNGSGSGAPVKLGDPLDVEAITEEQLLERTRLALYRVLTKACEHPDTMGHIAADVGKIVFDRANQIGAGGSYESRLGRR